MRRPHPADLSAESVAAAGWVTHLPWLILGLFAALWALHWHSFPLVLDPYYHMLVARQMIEAGGPIAFETWEWAPVGRPHMYPPVFHLLLAAPSNLGIPPLTAIRLASVALPVGLLLSLYLIMRRLFTPSTGLAVLLAGLVPFAFHLHAAVTLASTLALIQLLWLVDAVEHGRDRSAAVWLVLLVYTHLGIPWLALASLAVYGALRRPIRPTLAKACLGLIAAVPWWWHLAAHRATTGRVSLQENQAIEVAPALGLVAIPGLWWCLRQRGRWWLIVSLMAGFGLLALLYPFRWTSGEGMLPLVMLAGIGIDRASRWLARASAGTPRHAVACLIATALLCAVPTAARNAGGWRLRWPDSGPVQLLSGSWDRPRALGAAFAVTQAQRLSALVRTQTEPGEILWSNTPYVLGLTAALAGRPTSSAMLMEVRSSQPFDPVEAARLIVWLKVDPVPGEPRLEDLRRVDLDTVYEDDASLVLRRQTPVLHASPPRAALPFAIAAGLIAAALCLIIWDGSRATGSPQGRLQSPPLSDESRIPMNRDLPMNRA